MAVGPNDGRPRGWGEPIREFLKVVLWFVAFILLWIPAALAILAVSWPLGWLMTGWFRGVWVQMGLFAAALVGLGVVYRGFLGRFAKFCVMRPVQSASMALILALIYGQVGNGLGLPGLFWSEEPVTRVAVSFALTLVMALIGLNAFYLIDLTPKGDGASDFDAIGREVGRFLDDPKNGGPLRKVSRWFFLDFESWLEPLRTAPPSNPYLLSRFLRLVRLPFLTLLALPALLPTFFVNVPKWAPVVSSIDAMTLYEFPFRWDPGFRPDVSRDPLAFALGASTWLFGIWLGVQFIKLFVKISDWFTRHDRRALSATRARSLLNYVFFASIVYLTMALSPLYEEEDSLRPYVVVGAVLLVAIPLLCVPILYVLGRRAGGARGHSLKIASRVMLVVGLAEGIIFGPLGWSLSEGYGGIAPAVAILALLGMVALLSALFGLVLKDPRLRVLGILAIFGWISANNFRIDSYRFENLDYSRSEGRFRYSLDRWSDRARSTPAGAAGPGPGLVSDAEARERWKLRCLEDGTGCPDGRPKLVVVCVSGGAIRSAYWSATVLDRLGREVGIPEGGGPVGRPRPFDRHVRIIAGASGGMVGMPYYVRWLRDGLHGEADRIVPDDGLTSSRWDPGGGESWVDAIPPFSLRPVARNIALREIPYMFFRLPAGAAVPAGFLGDRGIELEQDWDALRFAFSRLAEAEEAGALPSLIFSPMTVEDGRRLLISNLDLRFLVDDDLPPRGASDPLLALNRGSDLSASNDGSGLSDYSLSATEFAKVFPRLEAEGGPNNGILLSTAARMSATFPYVSPAVYLPSEPPLRVVDAGYFDNYGVDIGTAWIFRNRDWILRNTSGVLIVQVRDSLSRAERFGYPPAPESPYAALLRGVQFFFSPIEAVSQARYTSSSFRNDAQVAALSDYFTEETGSRSFLTTSVFELSTDLTFPGDFDRADWPGDELDVMLDAVDDSGASDVAMNWYLTVAEREAVAQAIPDPARLRASAAVDDGGRPGVGTPADALEEAFDVDLPPIDPAEYGLAFGAAEGPRGEGIVPIDFDDPRQRAFRIAQLRRLRSMIRDRLSAGESTDVARDQTRLAVLDRALNRASSYEAIEQIKDWWPRVFFEPEGQERGAAVPPDGEGGTPAGDAPQPGGSRTPM